VNNAPETRPEDVPTDTARAVAQDRGWYLYGVAELLSAAADEGEISHLVGIEGGPVSLIPLGRLVAIVSPVFIADYSPETLSARATDAAWLEAMVRSHNDVIDAVHVRGTILPAKFGSVYAAIDDLRWALEPVQDALQDQLQRLRGTDEWAVHAYADRVVTEGEVAVQDPEIVALRSQLADARPGRAFFLQRKLADTLAAATDEALNRAAQEVHDRLMTHALDYQVTPPGRGAQAERGKLEILHAAYLVARDDTDRFLHAADTAGDYHPGMQVESTGPWPPYSFVRSVTGDAQ
jgi:hypothetical protein